MSTWADLVASMLADSAAKGRSRFRVVLKVAKDVELGLFEALDEPAPGGSGTTTPALTQAADPLDEPPVMCPRSNGFRHAPWCGLMPTGLMPISCMFALPTMTAPAAFNRATTVDYDYAP